MGSGLRARHVLALTAAAMIGFGFGVSAHAALIALASGLTVLLALMVARRSTFQNRSQHRWIQRGKRFVQSLYVLAATGVAMVWLSALDTWTTVLFALACGCVVAFALAVAPIRRRHTVTVNPDNVVQATVED